MTTQTNAGEGVPKETPQRHSLDTLRVTLTPVFGRARAMATIHALQRDGYFERTLLQQVDAAVQAVVAASSAREHGAVLDALKNSSSDRMRGYAAAVAFAFYGSLPERCLQELYTIGILTGTWAQESAQAYVKRLMQRHGVAAVLPLCVDWLHDPKPEARRLLMEALRPRGVWTGHLRDLRHDPKPLKPLLEQVIDDPSDYVRKAVANCINDVSKDHPDLVCRWAKRWHGKRMSPARAWVLKRGLRTLIKAGHPGVLALFGFDGSEARVTWDGAFPARIAPGEVIPIAISLQTNGPTAAGAHVQVVLEGPGRGTTPRRTIYQVAQVRMQPGVTTEVVKRIPFRHRNSQLKIPGRYRVVLQVNGVDRITQNFEYRAD